MTEPQPVYRWEGDDLILKVVVQPRASRNEIIGRHGDALKICLTASPTDGKANIALRKLLGKVFGVAASRIEIASGITSRHKCLVIRSPSRLPEL